MSIWPMPSTARRRRGWSMACSTSSPASFDRPSLRSPRDRARMDQEKQDPARRPGEFELIARYFRPLAAGREGALGLADDAALIDIPPGRRVVVTADALVAGVHFLPDVAPDLIARKMLR